MTIKHPMQPVYLAPDGVARFQQNNIVRYLLDHAPVDMNQISRMVRVGESNFSAADYCQLMQLIGYSVSGWSTLYCTPSRDAASTARKVRALLNA